MYPGKFILLFIKNIEKTIKIKPITGTIILSVDFLLPPSLNVRDMAAPVINSHNLVKGE